MWAFDHLAGASLRGDTMLEAFTLLGALAASTTTIELGTMVANVHHRTPALLAVAVATLEAIAERQVHLGLGAGAAPDSRWSAEMRAIGQPVAATVAERHAASWRRSTCSTGCSTRGRDDAGDVPAPPPPAARAARRQRPDAGGAGRATRRRRQRRLGPPATRRAARRRPRRTRRPARLPAHDVAPVGAELLDPDHPTRRAMAHLDRVVLVVPATVDAATLATPILG